MGGDGGEEAESVSRRMSSVMRAVFVCTTTDNVYRRYFRLFCRRSFLLPYTLSMVLEYPDTESGDVIDKDVLSFTVCIAVLHSTLNNELAPTVSSRDALNAELPSLA
jgi:hypothetical protein